MTLSIGVVFNLFTALYGTRVVYDYLNFKQQLKPFRFMHILGKTKVDFIRLHKAAFILSGALVALGLFACLQIERGKANLGVELAGGAMIQFKAEIGASVSRDLKMAALIAIAISLAGIIAYLAWRFDFRFGVAAAMATFHDVLAVLGVFYLMDKEITLLVITALLTLAGYSLTDTVVVFDRIRENLKTQRHPHLGQVINQSINQVLSRTIITSGTVMLVLVALMAMGGALLHDFALALLIGVAVGSYSSIFVASPIVYLWENMRSKKQKQRRKELIELVSCRKLNILLIFVNR